MAHSGDKKIAADEEPKDFDAASFFGERKQSHRMGCTCTTLIILFFLLLAGLIVAVVLMSRAPDFVDYSASRSGSVTTSAAQQIREALKNKNKEVTIVLTESEVNASFAKPGTQISLRPEAMYLVGPVMGFTTVVELSPKIEEGHLAFDVKSVKVGSLPVPKIVAAPLLGQLNSSLRESSGELAVINFTSVKLGDSILTLTGTVVGR